MKRIIYIPLACLLFALVYSCSKNEMEFKKYLGDKEVVYTGKVGKVTIEPGNLRAGLVWKSSTDPSITGYVVYWNNNADSQVVNITTKTDSVRTIIEGLDEYVYSFTIYSFDAKGNRSVSTEVNNAKIYGPLYASTLLNRAYNATTPYVANADGSVTLNFTKADTIIINTVIKYTNAAGVESELTLNGTDSVAVLPSFKSGTKVFYQSSYIPERTSIDKFTVAQASEYPQIIRYIQCDKSLFQTVRLPQDVNTYESGTSIAKLWDGSNGPQGYPNIFHSDGAYIPHVMTFDMGKVYNNLSLLEETGRDCCNNPDQFEIWGIESLNGATTDLRADNSGWKNEAIAKGWVLLKSVTRSGDGKDPLKIELNPNPPKVRYVRVRVLHTVTGSGYSNMSELTFWDKQ